MAVALAVGLHGACSSGPNEPNGTPTPTPTPSAPGPVAGRYQLTITPAPGCPTPVPSFSFTMDAASAPGAPKPGTQVVLNGDPGGLEAEFIAENQTLRGGIGTTHDGVLAPERFQLFMNVIATGPVVRASDGRGEVRSGTMFGTLSFAPPFGDEFELGTCTGGPHTFTLIAR